MIEIQSSLKTLSGGVVLYLKHYEMEDIMKNIKVLEAILKNLQLEIESAYATESSDDVIYAMVIGNHALSDMPKAKNIEDRTSSVAILYKKSSAKADYERIKQISKEIIEINTILEKIKTSVMALDDYHRELIYDLYWRNKTWSEISCNSVAKERKAKREKRKALEQISIISRITKDDYKRIMTKINPT